MKYLSSIIKGIAIGAGAIIPGISSGVLCIIFGIFEKLVNSVLGIFKNFKENIKFLLPILIGIGIGIFLFGSILNSFFNNYEMECKSLFLGFIVGGVPSLFKQINSKKKFKLHFLLFTLISFSIGLFLFLLENKISNSYTSNYSDFIFLFLSGFAMSAGVVIPGVSSTVILMCFGTYFIYLEAISSINLSVLFPMGLGLIGGSFSFLFIIRFLLKKFAYQTYYSIIGFVLGSIFVLLPTHFSFIYIILFATGFFISLKLENLNSEFT